MKLNKAPVLRLALLAGLSLLLVPGADALAQRGGRRPGRPGGNRNRRSREIVRYSVVRVGDEIRVVRDDGVEPLLTALREAHREALRRHRNEKNEKKEAQGSRRGFPDKPPKMQVFRVLAKSIDTKEEAEAAREKLVQKLTRARVIGFSVVRVDGRYEVVRNSRLEDFKKSLEDEYRRARQEYEQARKEAARNGIAFDQPRPRRSSVKVLAPTFVTEDEARAYAKNPKSDAR